MVWPIRSRNSSQVSGLLSMALGSRKPCSTRTLLRDTSPSYMAPICGTVTCDSSITSRKSSGRSEEHTSELQSPYDLGCRLLLEKKHYPDREGLCLIPKQYNHCNIQYKNL